MGIHHFASRTHAYILLLLYLKVSLAVNFISQSQSIRDDGVTLISQSGTFALGFFSPGNSNKRYLGIWYMNIPLQTVVWVANRNNPINDSTGILTLNSTGNLVLAQNHTVVWSTNSVENPQNPVANLLESGNLVVREEKEANPETYLWQSFDYPTDTFLPGMKFGWDLRTGLNRRLVAWKSPDDPSTGDFSWGMVLNNYPDAYMMKGTQKFYRAGPWNGLRPSGSPQIMANPIYDYKFVSNKDEIYFMHQLKDHSVISRQVLNITTHARQRFVWIEAQQIWSLYQTVPLDYCDTYGLCGAYGICTISGSPVCQCLRGFSPKSSQQWKSMDWSKGCVRNEPLSCKDGFVKMSNLKLPDTAHTWLDETITLEECRNKCLNNCSCMAYTNSDIRGQGSGCAMWFGDLVDIRQFSDSGQDLYVRMAASELGEVRGSKKKLTIIVVSTLGAISVMLLLSFCFCIYYDQKKKTEKSVNKEDQNEVGRVDDLDLPLLDFSTVAMAINNFSEENKIGEGGFGPVYKGRLLHGQEIAVKRLSKRSGQGMNEFKNEVKLLVKLQHRNLVKLLGCCIEGEDKMLVYEYMPNSSLDNFIFDDTKGKVLPWPKRFKIICGIARGLLYLHQDSRLRIIHRDLKPSNVLMDDKLNPKISDFGIARIFGGDQIEGKTKRVIGTYGYMAPEYAADGHFSIKSDVFSFGILVLEIISGKRSRGFYHPDQSLNLISHAWRLWKEGRDFELINANIEESCILSEVQRCIQIGLLCVQQYPEHRPTMSSVVLMLGSETKLDQPKEPAFYSKKDFNEPNFFSGQMEVSSTNESTITLPEAR